MAIKYRKLTKKDLDTFIDMRINQLREEGAKEDIDLRPALRDYYSRHMAHLFHGWLWTEIRLSEQAECRLSRNRRILVVQAERWGCFQVCLQTKLTADRGLQRSC